MRKEIKQWGNCAVIVISPAELKVFELEVGDCIDLVITNIKKKDSK